MTKSKTDKHLTLSYKKKTISKSDLHPLNDQIQDRQTPHTVLQKNNLQKW